MSDFDWWMRVTQGLVFGLLLGIILTITTLRIAESYPYNTPPPAPDLQKDLTDELFSMQWDYLHEALTKARDDGKITEERYVKTSAHLKALRLTGNKPYSDVAITENGSVIFNWNKVVYQRFGD